MRELFGALEPIHPEYRDRDRRLEVMDRQRLERVFLFPTLGVGMEEALRADPEAAHAAFHAFNQWLDEDWGFHYRDRLYAAPLLTLMIPERAVAELDWVLERDARLICLRAAPVAGRGGGRSLGDPAFDPFWARAAEAGITVAFHGGDSGYTKYADEWGEGGEMLAFRSTPLRTLTGDRAAFDTFAALVCHGVFWRHPRLRVASIEMGSDWVPYLLRKMRHAHGQMPQAFAQDPVDTFRRHVWVAPFHEEDTPGLKALLGADHLLMGSDWPHAEGIPEPTDFANELPGFTPAELRLVMRENALGLAQRV